MSPTLNEKFLAYLALISGLTLSVVAEYYSILGLTAIFSAAFIPVVIMGVALGVGKITATLWLKQNWNIAPWSVRVYLSVAILVLMVITSMGIFGFLSKAHSDQSLVSGDVMAKIAVYDEKIKTAKDNIDANRKALKQMDEAVDQVMGRSTTETGADKAVQIRRGQAKERSRLQAEITAEQKTISSLNEARAPIAAEVRKVEAEVGPIKYIAQFVYGETDDTLLEKAVTWVIIILIVVFDPLAVILLLASQISFQDFRKRLEESTEGDSPEKESDVVSTATVTTNIAEGDSTIIGLTVPEAEISTSTGFIAQEVASVIPEAVEMTTSTVSYQILEDADEETPLEITHPYLYKGDFWKKPEGWEDVAPLVAPPAVPETPKEYVVDAELIDALEGTVTRLQQENEALREKIKVTESSKLSNEQKEEIQSVYIENARLKQQLDSLYVQNEEQADSGLWNKLNSQITEEEYIEQSKQKKDDNSNNAS
jgi:Tfp pilus assembly protein PilO